MSAITTWTRERDNKLCELYPEMLNAEIAEIFGVSKGSISARAHKLNLQKTQAFKRLHAAKGQFKTGQVPVNKGKKMPLELYEKCKATMFKKGVVPHNTKKDLDISIRPDKNGKNYRFIRIGLGKWIPYARFIWEGKNGDIPKGMCIWHIDKNPLNDSLENLELITRKENRTRNSGSIQLSSKWVSFTIVGRNNMDLMPEIQKYPELIELKRNQIKLKRSCRKIA